MLIYVVSFVLTSIVTLVLGLFVFLQNRKGKVNQSWFFVSIAVAVYCFFFALHISASSSSVSLLWGKLLSIGSICVSPLFLSFAADLTDCRDKAKKFLRISYPLAALFLLSLFTDLFFRDSAPHTIFNFYATPGFLYPFYLAYFSANTLLGHYYLFKSLSRKDSKNTIRIKYMLFATFIAFFAGSSTFFPLYGISSMGIFSLLMPLYPLIVSIAIVRHQLMDVEVIIRRTAVFAGLFTFVYGVFTVVTALGQEFFKSTLGWQQWMALIPTVFVITFALRPLETFLTNITEKFLFQKKYDYRELLKTFTNEILTVLDLQKLMDQTIAGLTKIMKLESACVLLYDKEASLYKMVASHGLKDEKISFKKDDTIITYLKASQQHILMDKSVDKIEGDGHLKEDFKRLNAKLCLPIELHDDLIGVLCLGMKKSGEEFIQDDIDILGTLARTEAIAISNAQLFDELSKTQAEAAQREKMAVIGTLAAGINHEICNPLGIVRGHCEMFLLNNRDGFYKEKSREDILNISSEIMSKVIKETDRATSITKKLSSFAKPARQSEFEEVTIEKEVVEVLGLIEHDLQINNIDIQRDFPNNFPPILADRKQIQQVFFNIIRNAAQAIEGKRGRILISGFAENGSAVVRISDNGMGIPQEKIGQIFNPFYTTKDPGKGTGLGLFIVKQVVERNKGTIALESHEGVGTTFTLRFPVSSDSLALHN